MGGKVQTFSGQAQGINCPGFGIWDWGYWGNLLHLVAKIGPPEANLFKASLSTDYCLNNLLVMRELVGFHV